MPVDKAWINWVASKKFIGSYEGYRDAFEAGQKCLSPEVREVLEWVKVYFENKDDSGKCESCDEFFTSPVPIDHKPNCVTRVIENLLAKE